MNTDHSLSPETIEAGKPLALISYASLVVGLPLFILPMLSPDNAYALKHAKYAGVIFIGAMIAGIATFAAAFITCGLGTPLVGAVLLFYIPTIQGLLAALNGTQDVPMMVEPWAEKLFSGVKLKAPPELEE